MPERTEAMDELDRLWNDLLTGRQDASGYAVDPAVADTLHAFHALAAAPATASSARVDQAVLAVIEQYGRAARPPRRNLTPPSIPTSANGGGVPVALVVTHPAPRWWQPLTLASLVTAALVLLLLVSGLVLVRDSQRFRSVSDHPAIRTAPDGVIAGAPDAAPLAAEELWETHGADAMPLFHPFGVAVAPDGALWVADGARSQFQIFAPDGTFRETWGTAGSGNGQFSFTGSGDVAFDAAGNIYVVDTDNYRIQKFSPERVFLTAWGSQGSGDGQFFGPQFITVGPDGDLYVTDDTRNDIQRFDADGRYLNTIGEPGSGAGQLNSPGGVAIDRDGRVWVSDYNNNRIARFTSDGTFLDTWGSAGNRKGELSLPGDIAFDAQGRIYVLESGNKRVQVFDRDFQTVMIFGREDLSAQGMLSNPTPVRRAWFAFPAAMALDGHGHVYITDTMGNFMAAFRVLTPAPAIMLEGTPMP